MADAPEIAVIVGAYRREPFLLSAVRSVLAQSLPRDRYEILVTKNFRSDDVDRFLADQGIPTRFDDDERIGPWLLRAVRATRAPLIAFLDDDDEFEPERLSHVLEVFQTHPDLGLYRNRVRVIDERGEAIPPDRWRPLDRGAWLDRSGPVYVPAAQRSTLVELLRAQRTIPFNSSTMVVRRELLTGPFSDAFERSQLPDLTMFVLALVGPWGAYLDDRRLTRFRYYAQNVTHRVGWLRHAAEAHGDLAAFVRTQGQPELADWLNRYSDHYFRLFFCGTIVEKMSERAPRRDVAHGAGTYLRYLGQHPAERRLTLEVWSAVAYATAYLFLPGVARRIEAYGPARRRRPS